MNSQLPQLPSADDDEGQTMNEVDIAHLAGLFDGAGSVRADISKEEEYSLGYRYRPSVKIYRPPGDKATMGKLDEYSEENHVLYHFHEEHNSNVFAVTDPSSIENFLEPLRPWCITLHDEIEIMLEEVLPRLEEGEEKTRSGFYELVGFADALRGVARSGQDAKYTQDYFEEEWEVA